MIPFSMLRKRIIACSCLAMLFFGGSMYILTFYLPIYFQAVRNATPAMSGVYLLPSVLSQILFAIVSGVLVGKLGYYLPWAVASGLLVSIANGLISTLTPTSSTGHWIGYQIIGGAGQGCGLQMVCYTIRRTLVPANKPSPRPSLLYKTPSLVNKSPWACPLSWSHKHLAEHYSFLLPRRSSQTASSTRW